MAKKKTTGRDLGTPMARTFGDPPKGSIGKIKLPAIKKRIDTYKKEAEVHDRLMNRRLKMAKEEAAAGHVLKSAEIFQYAEKERLKAEKARKKLKNMGGI